MEELKSLLLVAKKCNITIDELYALASILHDNAEHMKIKYKKVSEMSESLIMELARL